MRIGIDIRPLMEGKVTGVQVYIQNLLREMFLLDSKNQYVLFANSFRAVENVLPRFEFPNVSVRVSHYPNKFFVSSQRFFGFPKIDRLLGGLDLFYSPHWRATALSREMPLVITVHDLAYEFVPDFYTRRQVYWHKFMNYRRACDRAARVIAVSDNTKQDLQTVYGTNPEKIKVIYPGVSLSDHSQKPEGLPDRYFLAFHTFEPRKNLDAVLEAYRLYREESGEKIPLVVAGSEGWKSEQVIKNLPSDCVILHNVTEEQKSYLYRHGFALIFASFYEGFGFPIVEAAAAGLPVISSFAGSLAEVGGDFALFINPFRPAQIAEAMLALENDPEFCATMASRGRDAASRFSWKKTAAETLALFNEVVK